MSYTCTFFMPKGFVKFEEGKVEIQVPDSFLTPAELATVAVINEAIERLKDGRLVRYDFDYHSFENMKELYKCEWLRSGNLKIHGPTDKEYLHCEKIVDAMRAHRTFTCPHSLAIALPKTRNRNQPKETTREDVNDTGNQS